MDEQTAKGLLRATGYEVFQYGWPDLLVVRPSNGAYAFVEVKGDNHSSLTNEQIVMHAKLFNAGLPVTVVRCAEDLECVTFIPRQPAPTPPLMAALRRRIMK